MPERVEFGVDYRDTVTGWRCGRGRPRWLRHLRAWVGGFFWLPCPVCGRSFGGQEWKIGNTIHPGSSEPGHGWGVCSTECRDLFNR